MKFMMFVLPTVPGTLEERQRGTRQCDDELAACGTSGHETSVWPAACVPETMARRRRPRK